MVTVWGTAVVTVNNPGGGSWIVTNTSITEAYATVDCGLGGPLVAKPVTASVSYSGDVLTGVVFDCTDQSVEDALNDASFKGGFLTESNDWLQTEIDDL